MAENINLRAANETPVVEAVSDGDKALLLDANGMAKQIPANKLGGGAGGGALVVYATVDADTLGNSEEISVNAYRDPEMTQLYTYAELKEYILKGMCIYMALTSAGEVMQQAAMYPFFIMDLAEARVVVAVTFYGSTTVAIALVGSDVANG